MAGCTLGESASLGEGTVVFITKASRAAYVCVGGGVVVCVCLCAMPCVGVRIKGHVSLVSRRG